MIDNDPKITMSPLCQEITEDGVTVSVEIYRLETADSVEKAGIEKRCIHIRALGRAWKIYTAGRVIDCSTNVRRS